MSTYDAYNLSLRDSTEFTVPTAGGSGGDSNFSTAKLTVDVSNLDSNYALPFVMVLIPTISAGSINSMTEAPVNENSEYDIPLYDGKLIVYDTGNSYFDMEAISGSVTCNPPNETMPESYVITGDITYAPNISGSTPK